VEQRVKVAGAGADRRATAVWMEEAASAVAVAEQEASTVAATSAMAIAAVRADSGMLARVALGAAGVEVDAKTLVCSSASRHSPRCRNCIPIAEYRSRAGSMRLLCHSGQDTLLRQSCS